MADEPKAEDILYFNGVDAATGEYDRPSMSSEELWKIVQGEATPDNLDELRFKYEHPKDFAIEEGRDPKKLSDSGWGVIFAHDADPAVKEALSALLQWREKKAGELFRVYEGPDGYREGESKTQFLQRHGAGPGPVKPEKVPYYLLIVGSPDKIPYRFQSQLDVQYAVGRIHFDTLDEYANYAQSVVTAESGQVKLSRTGAFFGVDNKDDQATALSAKYLVDPLYQLFSGDETYKSWQFTSYMKGEATKKQLKMLLGEQTPAFLFTASHGASFPKGDASANKLQRTHNGALICQDWPGPREWRSALLEDHYLAGDHLTSDSNLLGLIAFFFACYGGGTPRRDEFSVQAFRDTRKEIAPNNFVAHLPAKMLSQPKGGALAVIGHVERAWGYSFAWPKAGRQTAVFESTLKRLLDGHPVGSAVEYFNERYAELSTVLNDELEAIKFKEKSENPYELAGMWTANNDARGYSIIGDPAVRLPLAAEGEEGGERPVIEVQHTVPPVQEGGEAGSAEAAATPVDGPPADEDVPITDFAPRPDLGKRLANRYPGLEEKMVEDWIEQIERGYKNHEQVFQRILDTFLSNHRTTVTMYWILFLIGIGLFIAAAVLAVVMDGNYIPSAIMGGLGVVTFVSYFIGRSIQSVEENLEYITWLGLIYNTYWTRQAWTFESEGAQETLKEATDEALAQLEHMVDKHARARRLRPKIEE